MKSSLGLLLRQGCSARPITAQRIGHPSLSITSTPLHRSVNYHRLHTVAATSYPFSSQSLHSEHALNSASTSSSNSDSPPPPLPLNKKRINSARQGTTAQPRATTSKDSAKASPSSSESQQKQVEKNHLGTETENLQRAKADDSSKAVQSKATSNTSSQTSGKSPEPKKTLLERIKGLWENIKYLFRFYYQGTKQIWKDRQIVAELKQKITQREARGEEGLRWIENAIIKQHEADLRKLPLFLAILLILEEILPLVVIYAPSLLPSTCVLPSQSTKMRSGEERVRGLAVLELGKVEQIRSLVEQIVTQSETNSHAETSEKIQPLASYGPDVIRQVAQVYALSARGPSSMVISRIDKHLNKLQSDDELLRRALQTKRTTNQWKEIINSTWLWKACAKRGLRSFEADDSVMEKHLIAYLHLTARNLNSTHRSLIPLALYDGTMQDLQRLQGEAKEEHSKGIRRRTLEVVEEVKEAEKKKESQ